MAGELLELAIADDQTRRRVALGIYQAIKESFAVDKARITDTETRRRFKLCEQLVRELRADHGWAFTRIVDVMPTVLRCKLDGVVYDPTKQRGMWLG